MIGQPFSFSFLFGLGILSSRSHEWISRRSRKVDQDYGISFFHLFSLYRCDRLSTCIAYFSYPSHHRDPPLLPDIRPISSSCNYMYLDLSIAKLFWPVSRHTGVGKVRSLWSVVHTSSSQCYVHRSTAHAPCRPTMAVRGSSRAVIGRCGIKEQANGR